jgi:hypothetical protein
MLDGISQTPLDQVDLLLGCGDTPLRFLLEDVQHIHSVRDHHRIDCAPGIAREGLDDLQNACAANPFSGFAFAGLSPFCTSSRA